MKKIIQYGKVVVSRILKRFSYMKVQATDPLNGVKLEHMIIALVDHYGWDYLGEKIVINCFRSDPSIKSSLTFLRRTPWAREKVEQLYRKMIVIQKKNKY